MEIHLGKFSEVPGYLGLTQLFDGIVDDSTNMDRFLNEFVERTVLLIYDKEEFCGMVTMDPVEDKFIESHILLLPSKRRLSVKVMRYVIDITQKAGRVPMTSVSGDYPHIKRCLEILGLTVSKVEHNSIIKNGVSYDRTFMIYNKEKPL